MDAGHLYPPESQVRLACTPTKHCTVRHQQPPAATHTAMHQMLHHKVDNNNTWSQGSLSIAINQTGHHNQQPTKQNHYQRAIAGRPHPRRNRRRHKRHAYLTCSAPCVNVQHEYGHGQCDWTLCPHTAPMLLPCCPHAAPILPPCCPHAAPRHAGAGCGWPRTAST